VKIGILVIAAVLPFAGGCARQGDYRNVESSPQDWVLPGPGTETKVFGPMPFEEVKHFVRRMESDGWMCAGYEPAGHPFDAQYFVTMRHWR
jgi:hypothetical protein